MGSTEEDRVRSYLSLSEQVNGFGSGGRAGMAEALRDAVRMFQALKVEYALFGAFAVAAYVTEKRSTLDIDIVTTREAADLIRKAAPDFAFAPSGPADQSAILRFRHSGGADVDFICDPLGFADLTKTVIVSIAHVGEVPVAAIIDVAYSKLRTQLERFQRGLAKKASDRADLINLIINNPGIVAVLREKAASSIEGRSGGSVPGEKMTDLLEGICRDAGVEPAKRVLLSKPERKALLVAAAVAAVAVALALLAHFAGWFR
jgi:hypothetical protein